MTRTMELQNKMKEAISFTFNFYKENNRFPKTSEDPFYRSAIRYFDGAQNYRKRVLLENGYSEEEAEKALDKKMISKNELFTEVLNKYKETGILWSNSDIAEEHYGGIFYLRKAVLEELGYSKEDILYTIKSQITRSSIPLEDVIKPLEDYITQMDEVPKSYEYSDFGTIVKRFTKWEIAIQVALEHINNPERSVEDIYKEHRMPYLPNVETLEPIKNFIVKNNRLPKTSDISDYRRIAREYILWDNALDEAMEDLGYPQEKRIELFKAK